MGRLFSHFHLPVPYIPHFSRQSLDSRFQFSRQKNCSTVSLILISRLCMKHAYIAAELTLFRGWIPSLKLYRCSDTSFGWRHGTAFYSIHRRAIDRVGPFLLSTPVHYIHHHDAAHRVISACQNYHFGLTRSSMQYTIYNTELFLPPDNMIFSSVSDDFDFSAHFIMLFRNDFIWRFHIFASLHFK